MAPQKPNNKVTKTTTDNGPNERTRRLGRLHMALIEKRTGKTLIQRQEAANAEAREEVRRSMAQLGVEGYFKQVEKYTKELYERQGLDETQVKERAAQGMGRFREWFNSGEEGGQSSEGTEDKPIQID